MTLAEITLPPLPELIRRLCVAEYPVLREGLTITIPDKAEGTPPEVQWQLGTVGGAVLVAEPTVADTVIHDIIGQIVQVAVQDHAGKGVG